MVTVLLRVRPQVQNCPCPSQLSKQAQCEGKVDGGAQAQAVEGWPDEPSILQARTTGMPELEMVIVPSLLPAQ